jgi:hypothetical protein
MPVGRCGDLVDMEKKPLSQRDSLRRRPASFSAATEWYSANFWHGRPAPPHGGHCSRSIAASRQEGKSEAADLLADLSESNMPYPKLWKDCVPFAEGIQSRRPS